MTQERKKICYCRWVQSLNTWSGRSQTNYIFLPGLILSRVRSGRQIEWAQAKNKVFFLYIYVYKYIYIWASTPSNFPCRSETTYCGGASARAPRISRTGTDAAFLLLWSVPESASQGHQSTSWWVLPWTKCEHNPPPTSSSWYKQSQSGKAVHRKWG